MTQDIEIPLERGLNYYFENQAEFDRKELPEEKRVAYGFEAGRQFGRFETKLKVSRDFIPSKGHEWA